MNVSELEGLDETEGLGNRATDGQVVDGDLAEHTLGVDQEKTTEGNTFVRQENTVVRGDLVALVLEQGKLEVRAETARLSGKVGPGKVGEFRVARHGNDLGVDVLELLEGLVEGKDLGRADEGEVLYVKGVGVSHLSK